MKKYFMNLALLVGVAALSTGVASAASVCASSTIFSTNNFAQGTTLTQSGDYCTLGNVTFSNFTIQANSGFSNPGSAFSFSISSVDTQTGRITFGYAGVSAAQDIEVFYSITPGITSVQLSSNSAQTIVEIVCSATFGPGQNCGGQGGTVLGTGNITIGNQTTFAVTLSGTNRIFKDVTGGSDFTQVYASAAVPEPATFSMLGLGLVGLGFMSRRLRKNS